jgi:hypothetical protein
MTQIIRNLLLALWVIPVAFAQETTGGIQGVVKDASGGMVANATIELSGPALIGIRRVQTESSGAYRITPLPPGEYSMTVTAPGFRTHRQNGIVVAVGRLPNIDIDLQVGAVAESIEVAATTPLVDVT